LYYFGLDVFYQRGFDLKIVEIMRQEKHTVLIKNATVIDRNSPHHLKKADILIEEGIIVKIGKNLKESFGSEVVKGDDLHASIGWMDMHTNVQDPGFEYKEDIDSSLNAAAAGGFTEILSCSTTKPVIDSKSGIEYQLMKSKGHACQLHVSGSLSQKSEGMELAEMYDMHNAGAKAFYDYKSNVSNSQLLKLSLLYTKPFDGLVMCLPNETYLSENGVIHEGDISTINGLQGIPGIAEEIGVQRALKILEYSEHRLHLTSLSTTGAVDLVKKAKQKGLNITTGVSVANLMFTDKGLEDFDSNFKLIPPLRDEKTRRSLVKAVISGDIDVVISDHWPQNIESKDCEFEIAEFGMISLETTYAMLNTALNGALDQTKMIEILAENPREILRIPLPKIEVGEKANITLYQPNMTWKYDLSKSRSISRNSSLNGFEFKGRVLGIINNGTYYLN
jgi:dihydroorotase